MKWIPQRWSRNFTRSLFRDNPSRAADKINTSYISTSPGSSTVIWIAKGSLLARLPHGGLDHRPSERLTVIALEDEWINQRLNLHLLSLISNSGEDLPATVGQRRCLFSGGLLTPALDVYSA